MLGKFHVVAHYSLEKVTTPPMIFLSLPSTEFMTMWHNSNSCQKTKQRKKPQPFSVITKNRLVQKVKCYLLHQ